MKIIVISGSRADAGMMDFVHHEIAKIKRFKVEYVKIKIEEYIGSLSKMFSEVFVHITRHFRRERPDYIIVLGDRWEILACVLSATMFGVKVIHIGGGEQTLGAYDESFRRMISTVSSYHFVISEESMRRLAEMGINRNVFIVGSPRMDYLHHFEYETKAKLFKRFKLNMYRKTAVVVFHPETVNDNASEQAREIVKALKKRKGLQFVLIPPAQDKNSLKIREELKVLGEFRELEHDEWVSLLMSADVLIGNSSAGIMETPHFNLPSVNVGDRQKGRERIPHSPVFDCPFRERDILVALDKALKYERTATIPKLKPSTSRMISDILMKEKL